MSLRKYMRKLMALACFVCIAVSICASGVAADTVLAINPSIDLSKYDDISKVCDFTTRELRLDEDNALKLMMGDDITLERVDASGNWYVSGPENGQKAIGVFDNGEKFGIKNSGFIGGMSYSDGSKEVALNCATAVLNISSPVFLSATQRALFFAQNLDFMPLEAARESVLERLEALGMENLQLECEFALQKDTILAELERKAQENEGWEYDADAANAGAEDCYVFRFRQEFFGLPYSSHVRSASTSFTPGTYISNGAYVTVYMCESGILNIQAYGLRQPLDIAGDKEIITADAALGLIMEQYNGRRLTKDKVLDQFELEYCHTDMSDGVYWMRPVWAFVVKNVEKDMLTYDEYGIIDAITGDMILPA